MQSDILLINPAPARNFLWQLHLVKGAPVKISDGPALSTDSMMVAIHVGLEAGLAFHRFHLGDQAMFFKGSQGPIHSIQ